MLQELLVAERSIQDSLDSPVSELKSLVRFADRKKSELLSYISALEKLLPIPSNAEFESVVEIARILLFVPVELVRVLGW